MGICAELVEPNTETVSFSYVCVGGRTGKMASRKLHGGGEEAPMNATLDGPLCSNEERSSEDLTRRWARGPANLSVPHASNTNMRARHNISVGYAVNRFWVIDVLRSMCRFWALELQNNRTPFEYSFNVCCVRVCAEFVCSYVVR